MDRAVYERMAEIDGDHWWFSARRKIIGSLIRKQINPPANARILEVGCGTGSNIELLRQFGVVEAIEPDDGARALAIARTGAPIQGGLLPDGVKLEDGVYDMIVLLDVLEHIPDDFTALQALRPKLKAGGKLLLTVPAMPWLWSAHDVAHHHQRRYTAKTLDTVVMAAGFRVRHRSFFNTILFPLIVAARGVGRVTGREGGDDAMPPRAINAVLERLFAMERQWVSRFSFPFGVSLGLVAEPA
jgi:SAM-dependent methyltransferase